MFFRDVIGQEEAKHRLIQEVSEGRIPHAQLFCGPEGVGKFPLALAYARYLKFAPIVVTLMLAESCTVML